MFLQRFLSHLAAKLSARQSELDSAQALAKHSPRGSHESHTLWLEKAIHTIQGSHPTVSGPTVSVPIARSEDSTYDSTMCPRSPMCH